MTAPVPLSDVPAPCPASCPHSLTVHSADLGCWLCGCIHGRPVSATTDPRAALDALGAIWSDDFDAYASGELDASKVHCALCMCAPCRCPEFGTPAYFALLDFRHGRRPGDAK